MAHVWSGVHPRVQLQRRASDLTDENKQLQARVEELTTSTACTSTAAELAESRATAVEEALRHAQERLSHQATLQSEQEAHIASLRSKLDAAHVAVGAAEARESDALSRLAALRHDHERAAGQWSQREASLTSELARRNAREAELQKELEAASEKLRGADSDALVRSPCGDEARATRTHRGCT